MAISTRDSGRAEELRPGIIVRLRANRVLRTLLSNRVALTSLTCLLLIGLVALLAGFLTPQDPNAQDLSARLQGPSAEHRLGTDGFGRDVLSRLIAAAPVTLMAMGQGLGIALGLGIPVGLIAGYSGGGVDSVLSRMGDGMLALPPLILALAIVGVLGPGLTNAMVAVGVVLAPRFFRVARAAATSVREEAYVEAARGDACSTWRILWRHVVPNSLGPLIVQATFAVGQIIAAEASLSFLGLGVQAPQASWGGMVREAFRDIHTSPFGLIPPSTVVSITVLATFLVGDGLRDAISGRKA